MSSLAARFAVQMHKRAASAQGETTSGFEVPSDKRSKRSCSDPRAIPDPVGGSEPKPRDARPKPFIKYISLI